MKIIKPYQQGLAVYIGFWWSRCSQGTWPVSQYVLLYCTFYCVNICNKLGYFVHDLQQQNLQVLLHSVYVVTCGFFEQSLTVGKSELKYLFCCRTKKKMFVRFCFGICDFFFSCLFCFILMISIGDELLCLYFYPFCLWLMSWWLDLVILAFFSNLNDSVILWKCLQCLHVLHFIGVRVWDVPNKQAFFHWYVIFTALEWVHEFRLVNANMHL